MEDVKNDNSISEPKTELEKLTQERDEYLNGWKRAKADLMNFQRDEEKRITDLIRWGLKDIVQEMIPVLDNFELAVATLEKDGALEKGIQMIKLQLEDLLKKKGLEKISVEKGKPFDPNFHEAVGEIDSEFEEGIIAKEIEKGYSLNGKVLRPARVMISKAK
ncbi:MAG: nucleotide exchange factor GrpE [Candidatus Pacebacteria bacterium]|nr:nucleotide exchange factor GrpE [Candidatus Paceibacterota bacterium]